MLRQASALQEQILTDRYLYQVLTAATATTIAYFSVLLPH